MNMINYAFKLWFEYYKYLPMFFLYCLRGTRITQMTRIYSD